MQSNTQPTMETKENPCEDCKTCLEVLQIVLDAEASPEEVVFVEEHIRTCENCHGCYQVDKALRETIRLKIEKISPPYELIHLIQSKITQINL
ncbi:MAG: hypothetical protein OHK0053_14260 [Microscillaceae bacterium]